MFNHLLLRFNANSGSTAGFLQWDMVPPSKHLLYHVIKKLGDLRHWHYLIIKNIIYIIMKIEKMSLGNYPHRR